MTYLLLNLVFTVAAIGVMYLRKLPLTRPLVYSILTVIALTATFDPIIIGLDIVAYDPSKLIGVYWFGAPVEDFFYAILAPILVYVLWHTIGKKD